MVDEMKKLEDLVNTNKNSFKTYMELVEMLIEGQLLAKAMMS